MPNAHVAPPFEKKQRYEPDFPKTAVPVQQATGRNWLATAPLVSFASAGVPSVLSGSEGCGISIHSTLLPCRPPRALSYGPYC